MKLLRQNSRLVWVLATLFAAQFFVPLALASLRSDIDNIGIVICTSSGLKQFTPNGEPRPNQQNVGQKDCLICLTTGLGGGVDLAPLPKFVFNSANFNTLKRYYGKTRFLFDTAPNKFKARAPPLKS